MRKVDFIRAGQRWVDPDGAEWVVESVGGGDEKRVGLRGEDRYRSLRYVAAEKLLLAWRKVSDAGAA